jgi:beta-N-acetylhexosaminidase
VTARRSTTSTTIRLATPLTIAAFVALTACAGPPPPGANGSTTPTTPTTLATSPTSANATTTPIAPTTTVACSNQSVIGSWSVSRRASELVVVPVLSADPAAIRVALDVNAGGLLLLGPLPNASQLAADLAPAARRTNNGSAPFVMVDEEGGEVQRLGTDVQSIPSARQMAATMTTAQVEKRAENVGRQMLALGVDVDLAPVLDLDGGPSLSAQDPDGPRSFSTDPSVASAYGMAFAAGLRAAGVLPVAKHFPGLGDATGNTDYGPASTPPISQLRIAGLLPFQRAVAAGAPAVMVSNATVPGVASVPASVSPAVINGLLRSELHFNGLVMTDSLSAGAVSSAGYSVPSAAVASIEAGGDMVLFGSTLTAADTAALAPAPLAAQTSAIVAAITGAVTSGALTQSRLDDAVLHVVQARGTQLCPAG